MNVNVVNLVQAGTPVGVLALMLWGLFLRGCHDKASRVLAALFCGTLFLIGMTVLSLLGVG